MSDCGAIADFLTKNKCSGCSTDGYEQCHGLCDDANYTSQCPACTSKCMATAMFKGGTDTACGGAGDLMGALKSGTVTKAELVASAWHVLRPLFALGHSNPTPPWSHLGALDIYSPETRRLNREAAQQSVVLLKNEPVDGAPVLPLPRQPGLRVAALGYIANNTGNLLSNYHGATPPKGSRLPWISPADALVQLGYNVTYAPSGSINLHGLPPDEHALNESAKIAAASDVAIMFVGLDAGDEHESGDRNQTGDGLGLPGSQEQMIKLVLAAQPRSVVVLVHGGPIAIESAKANAPAIVDAHYPGEQGGLGIVDVLTGAFNPCGRLTTTVYPKAFANRSIYDTGLRSDGGITYMHYDGRFGAPLWEFGDGISYSSFLVEALGSGVVTLTTAALAASPVTFTVTVTNKVGPAGCFSVLGFVSSSHPDAPRNRKLFDYTRVNLAAGGKTVATVQLTAHTGGLVAADGTKSVLPGTYNVSVGDASFTLDLTGEPVVVAPPPPLRFVQT